MPPSLDKPGVRMAGVSEACGFNDHADCRIPGCGCDCHVPKTEVQVVSNVSIPPGPEKACPKCGVKRPFSETYCRIDGSRLASLLCGVCGVGMEVGDGFCWGCGATKGEEKAIDPRAIPSNPKPTTLNVPGLDEGEEVDYGSQVVRALQEELEEGDSVQPNQEPKVTVEQPAGTQGSFRLVSKPNPQRLRTGASVGVPGPPAPAKSGSQGPVPKLPFRPSRLPIKLPIKPS